MFCTFAITLPALPTATAQCPQRMTMLETSRAWAPTAPAVSSTRVCPPPDLVMPRLLLLASSQLGDIMASLILSSSNSTSIVSIFQPSARLQPCVHQQDPPGWTDIAGSSKLNEHRTRHPSILMVCARRRPEASPRLSATALECRTCSVCRSPHALSC